MSCRITIIALALIVSGRIAHAITLSTPLLQGGTVLACAVTNVGTKDAKLDSIEMFDISGALLIPELDTCNTTLTPKESCYVSQLENEVTAFCQVSGSGKLRVSIIGLVNGTVTAALSPTTN